MIFLNHKTKLNNKAVVLGGTVSYRESPVRTVRAVLQWVPWTEARPAAANSPFSSDGSPASGLTKKLNSMYYHCTNCHGFFMEVFLSCMDLTAHSLMKITRLRGFVAWEHLSVGLWWTPLPCYQTLHTSSTSKSLVLGQISGSWRISNLKLLKNFIICLGVQVF